jgi:hypothetical protein
LQNPAPIFSGKSGVSDDLGKTLRHVIIVYLTLSRRSEEGQKKSGISG